MFGGANGGCGGASGGGANDGGGGSSCSNSHSDSAAAAAGEPVAKRQRVTTFPSSNSGDSSGKEQLLKQLECPVCLETIPPPIHQCKSGHLLCGECRERLPVPKRCPECRADLSDIRCLALEQLAESILQLPCPFAQHGCDEQISYGQVSRATMSLLITQTCSHHPSFLI